MSRSWRLKAAALPVCAALLAWVSAAAHCQTLHQRKPSAAGPELSTAQPAAQRGSTPVRGALPLAAEGEYRWGEAGEVIELYVEGAELRGYLTRRSERRDAGSAPMTFRFAEASAHGDQLSFATRHIHGDWYSFTGRVVRGTARTPHEDGYYLLTGTLAIHLNAGGADSADSETPSAETVNRQVSFKLTGASHSTSVP